MSSLEVPAAGSGYLVKTSDEVRWKLADAKASRQSKLQIRFVGSFVEDELHVRVKLQMRFVGSFTWELTIFFYPRFGKKNPRCLGGEILFEFCRRPFMECHCCGSICRRPLFSYPVFVI